MNLLLDYQDQLINGTIMTIKLALTSLTIALIFGLLGAWAKLSSNRAAQRLAGAYTTVVRGVPDLVLILLVFFGGQVTLNNLGAATGLWGTVDNQVGELWAPHLLEGVALARPSYGKLQRCLCACAEARVLAWEGRVRGGLREASEGVLGGVPQSRQLTPRKRSSNRRSGGLYGVTAPR